MYDYRVDMDLYIDIHIVKINETETFRRCRRFTLQSLHLLRVIVCCSLWRRPGGGADPGGQRAVRLQPDHGGRA